ncbi:MAG: alpha/beta hydrolase [Eubacteriales bacterium]|nr:alpha/beta hydrolase [Eubacteriales bacterium]
MAMTQEFWDRMREEWKQGDAQRDAGLTTPEDVVRYDDLAYGPDGVWNLLDIYRQRELPEEKMPVIISIHGGGWFYGTKEIYQYYLMDLAKRGFITVNFNYHLAPEHPFPAAVSDMAAVIRFVQEHAQEYHMDLSRVILIGDSAGGQMCGMYTNFCTNPEYAQEMCRRYPEQFPGKEALVPNGFVPAAVGLHCGVYDTVESYCGEGTHDDGIYLDALLAPATRDKVELIDVIRHMSASFPPAYVLTAEHDFLVYQMPLLTARMDQLGIRYQAKEYGKGDEQVQHVFMCNLKLAEATLANDEECAFFHKVTAKQ